MILHTSRTVLVEVSPHPQTLLDPNVPARKVDSLTAVAA